MFDVMKQLMIFIWNKWQLRPYDEDDDIGVLCPFQHYLSHTEMMEGW